MPLVSVIIPNYNHEKFLQQRIDSVLNQTFQDFEVILLDDSSIDESLEILNKYENHPKVSHLIINKMNSCNPFKQWEKGIKLAKGDFIWIAESDDFAENCFLEETVNVFKKYPNTSLVYTDSMIINNFGENMGLWSTSKNYFFETNRWSFDYVSNGKDEIIDYLLYKTTINNMSAVMFKKSSFLNIDWVKLTSYKNVGDLFLYISILIKGEVYYLSSPLNNYREHNDNFTKKNKKSGLLYSERINCFAATINLLSRYNGNKSDLKRIKKAYKYIIKKNSFKILDFGNYIELKSFIKKMIIFNFLNKIEGNIYLFLFNLYKLNFWKFKGLSKVLIKSMSKRKL